MEAPTDTPPVEGAWARSATEVLEALEVDPARGLTPRDVEARRERYGSNALREVEPRKAWAIFFAQFKSLLVGLLFVAVILALTFREWVEAGAIGVVLLLNALLGFATELRAARSMEALRKMGATTTTVRRDGESAVLEASRLVPGDIVTFEGGDVVTADLRVIEASKLQANESTLTGESLPVGKSVDAVAEDASIGERRGMLYKGTVVTRGSGLGVVVATGMSCELGRISRLVAEAEVETTPLEQRLDKLGHGLVWATLVIAALIVVSGYAAGQATWKILETAIALAVAAVPEGLPIIATIALARGMHRMARHDALVNRLSAVETLGATSILCTDKTGTLTENRMSVEHLELAEVPEARRRALEIGALCNNAELTNGGPNVGDPMEVALLLAARKEGIERNNLARAFPEQREFAFDPDLKMMATLHGTAAPFRIAVKGAPEAVLGACELDEAARQRWSARAEALAVRGLRVLAVAERSTDDLEADPYRGLELVGLVAMHDPPRAEIRTTMQAFQHAGVRVVMVTGDHPTTARNIALATGLVDEGSDAATLGSALEHAATADPATQQQLREVDIFARVSPKQKLDLIALHQSAGAIVAMTGDGVNDAPALRKADIGVAMGTRGTAAAKEAAAMVLQDDDFATLPLAIAEGRAIFDNIRKFVVFLLSCNISEVAVVAIATLVGGPLPLLPLQILFLNLVTDVFPALALGMGEADEHIMARPPRDASEPIIGARHWRLIIAYGVLITACVLGAFLLALRTFGLGTAEAVTVSFLTLALAQLWHVFNMRRPHGPVLRNEITRNPWIWAALAICVALLGLALYLPPLARLLSIAPPGATGWMLVGTMSVLPLLVIQPITWLVATRARRSPPTGA